MNQHIRIKLSVTMQRDTNFFMAWHHATAGHYNGVEIDRPFYSFKYIPKWSKTTLHKVDSIINYTVAYP